MSFTQVFFREAKMPVVTRRMAAAKRRLSELDDQVIYLKNSLQKEEAARAAGTPAEPQPAKKLRRTDSCPWQTSLDGAKLFINTKNPTVFFQ